MTKWLIRKAINIIEPVSFFSYQGKEYPVFSSFGGHYKPGDAVVGKQNRFAKLGKMADKTVKELKENIKLDPLSLNGRLSFACLLMMLTGIRIGNESSAEGYVSNLANNAGETVQTFGVTTLKPEHVQVSEDTLQLNFLGKKQVAQNIKVIDPVLVDVGKLYLNDKVDPFAASQTTADTWIGIDIKDLTTFIKQNFGEQMIPKDLRTFRANTLFIDLIRDKIDATKVDKKTAKEELKIAIEGVAKGLGNTPSVTKSAYLDSRALDWYIFQRTEGLTNG
ncbi:MAG: hypothetical protein WC415_06480 [Patescibacteria group bacterium]|jgi:DNA topoisomerase-1